MGQQSFHVGQQVVVHGDYYVVAPGSVGTVEGVGVCGLWVAFPGGPASYWISQRDAVALSPAIEDVLRTTYPHGHPAFIPTVLDLIALHSAKNADYAGSGPALGNFERVSKALAEYGVSPHSPASVALIYMMKQVDAVMYAVGQGRTLNVESTGDRLRDVAVYAILAKIMLEGVNERQNEQAEA